MASTTAARLWTLVSACLLVSAAEVTIPAEPGQTVSLSCRAPTHTNIIVVEWIRPDLKPEYVFVYRDQQPDPENQHPSFKNRVELKDRETQDGDVSVILKNVTRDDAGRYECKIIQRGTGSRRKRAIFDTETIKIIYLDVQAGHTRGHIWTAVGLSAALLVVAAVGFLIYRRHQPSYEPAHRPAEPPQV